MTDTSKKWVVLVSIAGWSNKWRPIVKELSRDCPKTIFTKGMWGAESRWHKDEIRYQIFGDETTALNAIGDHAWRAIEVHRADKDRVRTSDKLADDAVQEALENPVWLGGKG